MNVLHILGNGFDKNLKIKSGYHDFYNYYNEIENDDSIIKKLKGDINLNSDNWSDLEIALGKYTANLSKEDFIKVYEDLVINLCEYLEKEMESFQENTYSHNKMFSYLAFASDYLEQKDKLELQNFISQTKENVKVDVITLNYTKTLEKILMLDERNGGYSLIRDRVMYTLGEVKHLHGYTDERVILGVNDSEQISNQNFHNDIDINEMFLKYESNFNQRHNVDSECYSLIEEANLIYIFGSSLGQTDIYLWKLLGKRLQEGTKIVIFKTGQGIDNRLGHQLIKSRKETRRSFLELSGVSEEYKDNIYIGIKTKVFCFE